MNGESGHTLFLDGNSLTITDVVRVARHKGPPGSLKVVLADAARQNMQEMRDAIEKKIDAGEIMYGVNTGCGSNRNRAIGRDKLLRYQYKYICAHACGIGEPLQRELVRAMMLIRINSFAKGHSGVTLALCDLILELLNQDIIPVIPKYGSVGASGDLIPLAHLGAVLIGLPGTKVYLPGSHDQADAIDTFKLLGLRHHVLEAKEAMGLTNGATLILAYLTLGVHDSHQLQMLADICVALQMEAIRGEVNAFDSRIHKVRGHPGQSLSADYVLKLLSGSQHVSREAQSICFYHNDKAECKEKCTQSRVQDHYSLRCSPQCHGAAFDTIRHVEQIVATELNSATDNPLIFKNADNTYDVRSGGNFHGEPLAIACDLLGIAVTKMLGIAERSFYRLLSNSTNWGLPQDLSGSGEEDDTGLMITQYAAAALKMMSQHLSNSASVLNVDTSDRQEDHISNGAVAAWKLHKIIGNAQSTFAIYLLGLSQAVTLCNQKLPVGLAQLGLGTTTAMKLLRETVPFIHDDVYLEPLIQKLRKLIRSEVLVTSVNQAILQ